MRFVSKAITVSVTVTFALSALVSTSAAASNRKQNAYQALVGQLPTSIAVTCVKANVSIFKSQRISVLPIASAGCISFELDGNGPAQGRTAHELYLQYWSFKSSTSAETALQIIQQNENLSISKPNCDVYGQICSFTGAHLTTIGERAAYSGRQNGYNYSIIWWSDDKSHIVGRVMSYVAHDSHVGLWWSRCSVIGSNRNYQTDHFCA